MRAAVCPTGGRCRGGSGDRGRPPDGYFTKRTAEAWLRDLLDEARRGTLAGMHRSGVTIADAAAEWLRSSVRGVVTTWDDVLDVLDRRNLTREGGTRRLHRAVGSDARSVRSGTERPGSSGSKRLVVSATGW
jgi:hypothetical protein